MDDLFRDIGELFGAALRALVEALDWFLSGIFGAVDSFVEGVTSALGIPASVFSVLMILLGIYLLYLGARALTRRAVVSGVIWLILGLILLSALIN